METLGGELLLHVLERYTSVGDALAVSQCVALARRVVTDEWLDRAFGLPSARLREAVGVGQTYRQLLCAVFLSGSFFAGEWGALSEHSEAVEESNAYFWRITGLRQLQVKMIHSRYGQGFNEGVMGEGRGVAEVSAEGGVAMVVRGAAIDKTHLREEPSEEVGTMEAQLVLLGARAPPELRLCFGGVQSSVYRES
jgi:hypothetical protein